ncbi:hypothetical protein DCC39_10885 [Pueribacillus theae]|uniref:DUF4097 domain-containing protein n=1 Tax=Pueribacillus theae TaxID=2171751 RepID=A0A2U1JZL6_9BACI|nr:DUF4097 family beta strand repeat-containing protein [Pueribacillus theae]PWA10666.1 hypothetical protein DCC39_10885 [Pueribacillus theae]
MKKLVMIGIALVVIGGLGMFITGTTSFSVGPKAQIDEEKQMNADNITNLDIKVDVGKVRIKESKGDKIDVHFHGKTAKHAKKKFDVKSESGTLNVTALIGKNETFNIPYLNIGFDYNKDYPTLDIHVPKKTFEKIAIKADVGEIHLGDIDVKALNAANEVGQIVVEKFNGDSARLSSSVGMVKVKSAVGKIDVRTETGTIEVTMEKMTENLNATSEVGEVKVMLKEVPTDLKLDLASEVGRAKVKGLTGFDNLSGGNIKSSIGENGPTLKVRTEVGAISVRH